MFANKIKTFLFSSISILYLDGHLSAMDVHLEPGAPVGRGGALDAGDLEVVSNSDIWVDVLSQLRQNRESRFYQDFFQELFKTTDPEGNLRGGPALFNWRMKYLQEGGMRYKGPFKNKQVQKLSQMLNVPDPLREPILNQMRLELSNTMGPAEFYSKIFFTKMLLMTSLKQSLLMENMTMMLPEYQGGLVDENQLLPAVIQSYGEGESPENARQYLGQFPLFLSTMDPMTAKNVLVAIFSSNFQDLQLMTLEHLDGAPIKTDIYNYKDILKIMLDSSVPQVKDLALRESRTFGVTARDEASGDDWRYAQSLSLLFHKKETRGEAEALASDWFKEPGVLMREQRMRALQNVVPEKHRGFLYSDMQELILNPATIPHDRWMIIQEFLMSPVGHQKSKGVRILQTFFDGDMPEPQKAEMVRNLSANPFGVDLHTLGIEEDLLERMLYPFLNPARPTWERWQEMQTIIQDPTRKNEAIRLIQKIANSPRETDDNKRQFGNFFGNDINHINPFELEVSESFLDGVMNSSLPTRTSEIGLINKIFEKADSLLRQTTPQNLGRFLYHYRYGINQLSRNPNLTPEHRDHILRMFEHVMTVDFSKAINPNPPVPPIGAGGVAAVHQNTPQDDAVDMGQIIADNDAARSFFLERKLELLRALFLGDPGVMPFPKRWFNMMQGMFWQNQGPILEIFYAFLDNPRWESLAKIDGIGVLIGNIPEPERGRVFAKIEELLATEADPKIFWPLLNSFYLLNDDLRTHVVNKILPSLNEFYTSNHASFNTLLNIGYDMGLKAEVMRQIMEFMEGDENVERKIQILNQMLYGGNPIDPQVVFAKIIQNILSPEFQKLEGQKKEMLLNSIPHQNPDMDAFKLLAVGNIGLENMLRGAGDNVHSAANTRYVDLLLHKLLEIEPADRWQLTEAQIEQLFVDIGQFLRTGVPAEVPGILDDPEAINRASANLELIRNAFRAGNPTNDAYDKWFGYSKADEIKTKDRDGGPMSMGRTIQLSFDLLMRSRGTEQYVTLAAAFVNALSSNEAIRACSEGALTAIIRSTEAITRPTADEADPLAASSKDEIERIVTNDLKKLKTFALKFMNHMLMDPVRELATYEVSDFAVTDADFDAAGIHPASRYGYAGVLVVPGFLEKIKGNHTMRNILDHWRMNIEIFSPAISAINNGLGGLAVGGFGAFVIPENLFVHYNSAAQNPEGNFIIDPETDASIRGLNFLYLKPLFKFFLETFYAKSIEKGMIDVNRLLIQIDYI